MATTKEKIPGQPVKRGSHATINQNNTESNEVYKQYIKELKAENIRLKAEIADAKKKLIDLATGGNGQDDLQEHLGEIEAIFDSAPIGMCVLDRNLRYVRLNKRFAEINGESVEKHIGKTPRQIVPDLSEQAEEAMCKVLETGEPLLNFEISGITPAQPGVRRYWNENWLPLKDRKGKIVGVSITAEEITERKLAEEGLRREKQQLEERTRELEETNLSLRRSEEKFYKAFHSSPAMMSITRLKDNILIDVNESFTNALGYRREEMIGRSPLELNVWFDLNKREEMVRVITEKGSIKGFESKFIKKSGEIGCILASLNIVNLNADDCLLVTAIDITERIKAEEALRKSQELFTVAFDYAPYSLLITSLKDGRIKKANKEFLLKNGFTEEEVIGRSTVDLNLWFDPGDRVSILKQLEEKDNFYQELKLRKKDGQVLTVMFTGGKIDIDGEECLITIQNDITDLKLYQNELARFDRLNLIGEMAAGIGHEVRNPMTTVKGFLQLLKEKERYAQDRDIMDLMVEELDRANSIITEFLSLAKNKAVELKSHSLNQKVRAVFPLLKADAMKQDKNIELELGDIPHIKIDKNEIQQLILNLVHNGLEAMQPGGLMTIKTFQEDDMVVLAVTDQGIGIVPEVLAKIGTPFFTTKDNGTGLGLAVCYSIAARHNARIDIDTGPEGTTFFVKFKD